MTTKTQRVREEILRGAAAGSEVQDKNHLAVRGLVRAALKGRSEVPGTEIESLLAKAGFRRTPRASNQTVMFGTQSAQLTIPLATLDSRRLVKARVLIAWVQPVPARVSEAAVQESVRDSASAQQGTPYIATIGDSPINKPRPVKMDFSRRP